MVHLGIPCPGCRGLPFPGTPTDQRSLLGEDTMTKSLNTTRTPGATPTGCAALIGGIAAVLVTLIVVAVLAGALIRVFIWALNP